MPYNLTAIGGVNSTLQLTQQVNTNLMDGWLGSLILITLTIIIYMAFINSTRQPVKSFVGTMFISFILSLLLYLVSLVPIMAVWLTLIGAAVSIAFWNLD